MIYCNLLGVDLGVRALSARCFGFIASSPQYEDGHFQRVSSPVFIYIFLLPMLSADSLKSGFVAQLVYC